MTDSKVHVEWGVLFADATEPEVHSSMDREGAYDWVNEYNTCYPHETGYPAKVVYRVVTNPTPWTVIE